MDILFLAINAVLPIFLMMIFGYALKQKKIITDDAVGVLTKIVFRFALPTLIFLKIIKMDSDTKIESEQYKLMLFCFIGILVCYFITVVVINTYHKITKQENSIYKGAMNQGAWRTNFQIIGYPVLYNIFGDDMILNFAMLTMVSIPTFNILAIIALSGEDGFKTLEDVKKLVKKIFTNPLIIAVILGFIGNSLPFTLPSFLDGFLVMLSTLATPLGLISIGAFFKFDGLRKALTKTVISSSLKIIVFPVIFSILAYLLGFSVMNVIMVTILFGGPTAISSFAMSKEMNSDATLAGNIIILSSAVCTFTYMALITFWLSVM